MDTQIEETMNKFLEKIDDAPIANQSGQEKQGNPTGTTNAQTPAAADLARMISDIASASPSFAHQRRQPGSAHAPVAGAPMDQAAVAAAIRNAAAAVFQQQQEQQQQQKKAALSDVLTPEVIIPMLMDGEILAELATHLPDTQRGRSDIASLISSPQFRQQSDAFSRLLNGGELSWGQLQLGVNGTAAPGPMSVAEFLEAMEAAHAGGGARRSGDDDGDADMT